jgi:hypothetical protein
LPTFGSNDEESGKPRPVVAVNQPAVWMETPAPARTAPAPGNDLRPHATKEKPPTVIGQIRAYLSANPGTAAPTPAPTLPKLSPVPPNLGGQAETQPARVITSGLGVEKDG